MKKYLLLLLALFAASCSTHLTRPEVNLVDVKFLESTILETNLEVKIRIINPKNEDLVISGSEHKLTINDIDLGKALSNNRIRVPALGEATDLVTFRVSNLKLMTQLEQLINSKKFTYQIDSFFYTNHMFGLGTMTTRTSGNM